MTISSAEIKRQILMSAGQSDIRRKIDLNPPGISDGETIEIGNALELLTQSKGWNIIETYMIRRMNIVGLVMGDAEKVDPAQKGIAKGFMELMQWIQIMIQKRNEILEKERIKHGKAESLPQDEGKQGM